MFTIVLSNTTISIAAWFLQVFMQAYLHTVHPLFHPQLHPDNPRVFLGFNDTLYVGVLPISQFSGGHTYYIQRLHEVSVVRRVPLYY